MAIRSNSKKAKENIYSYIRAYAAEYLSCDYGIDPADIDSKKGLYSAIWGIFTTEKSGRGTYYAVFQEWASGLAMGGLFCYYYNRSAIDDLSGILEETAEEAARFTEAQAEETLTRLIYRELTTI